MLLIITGCFRGGQPYDDIRIQPCHENPRYWQYQGEPVLLLGGTKDDNLFQISDIEVHLDNLVDAGGNYVRNTMSARDSGNVQPFMLLSDGRYDLSQWNPEYWNRLKTCLDLTLERDIVMQIEFWAFHDFNDRPGRGTWLSNPWNPVNNVNYDSTTTALRYRAGNLGNFLHPFFLSIPAVDEDSVLLHYQQQFVEKILCATLDYPHVLYCITNEIHSQFPPEWGWYWAQFAKDAAARRGRSIEITEMLWHIDFEQTQQRASLDHPEIYTFFEGSQNSFQKGETHWQKLQFAYDQISANPRPINHVKIYGADTGPDWAGLDHHAEDRFWKNIIGGSASSRFHRPLTGLGLSDKVRRHLKSMRMLEKEIRLHQMVPDSEHFFLSSRDEDEAYAMVQSGTSMVVYFPHGGEVDVDVSRMAGDLSIQWLDITASRWKAPQHCAHSDSVSLNTPDRRPWLAVIKLSN